MTVRMTSPTRRSVPPSVAGILAELELLAPTVVDRNTIVAAMAAAGDSDVAAVDEVIARLRRGGWLLPLRTRGVWEFAPAARSGAFTSGDPLLELRAALAVRPEMVVCVSMESAAFRHGLTQHPPAREVLVVGDHVVVSGALKAYRLVQLTLPEEASAPFEGIPMHTVAGLLAAMAIKPGGYRDWANVSTWLPDAAAQVSSRDDAQDTDRVVGGLARLLADGPVAAWARAAYLLRAGGQEQAAGQLLSLAPQRPSGPVYLGPRGRRGRYDAPTGVYDALLVDVTQS